MCPQDVSVNSERITEQMSLQVKKGRGRVWTEMRRMKYQKKSRKWEDISMKGRVRRGWEKRADTISAPAMWQALVTSLDADLT